MFNARRSALFVAIIGLGFAAGEAGAACSPSAKVGGVLVCMNAKPGSVICDTQVQVDPQCNQTESCGFGSNPFTPATNLTSACSYTGATVNGFIYPPGPVITFNTVNPLKAIQAAFVTTSAGDDDEDEFGDDDKDKKHKKIKCKNGYLKGVKPPVPCTKSKTDGTTDALFSDPGLTYPVSDLGGDPVPMKCNNNGVCKATEEILPTGLFCPNGSSAIDFTPLRTSSFIVAVRVENANTDDNATAHFGCLGSQGNQYSCEAISDFGFHYVEDANICADGGEGGYGDSSGKLYCQSGDLPAATRICGTDVPL